MSAPRAAGKAWLAALDSSIAWLEKQWRIETGEILTGGSEALVVAATDKLTAR